MAKLRATAEEPDACVVCFDAPNAYACLPRAIVPQVHEVHVHRLQPRPWSCPICRQAVASFVKICDAGVR